MGIDIDLDDDVNFDWLHHASEGNTADIWDGMTDEERRERARKAVEDVLADRLDGDRDAACELYDGFSDEEHREIARAAINRDGGDFLNRTADEMLERAGEQ